jgi:hypothetical protein
MRKCLSFDEFSVKFLAIIAYLEFAFFFFSNIDTFSILLKPSVSQKPKIGTWWNVIVHQVGAAILVKISHCA